MTEHEQQLVARRAWGEYAVIDPCMVIWKKYRKKERSAYTDYLRMIFGGRGADGRAPSLDKWDEYEAAARAVLDLHPDLHAPPPEPAPKVTKTSRKRKKTKKKKKKKKKETPVEPPQAGQLRRNQIIEALRRPWPKRDL